MRNRVSRRAFMHKAAGAASVALAGRTILLDAANSPTAGTLLVGSARPAAAGDAVRFGMIGIGMQGSDCWRRRPLFPESSAWRPAIFMTGAINSPKRSWAQHLITTRRYQELLDSKNVDCLIAAVPDHWHKQIIVDA